MRRFVLAASLIAGMTGGFVPSAEACSEEESGPEHAQKHEADCEQSCPGDDEEGNCPPGCDDCGCCPGVAPGVAVEVPKVGAAPAILVALLPAPATAPTGLRSDVWRPPRG
ncbi:MAG: hypothetical protein ACOCUS_01530 [Polyangiales bacterium]